MALSDGQRTMMTAQLQRAIATKNIETENADINDLAADHGLNIKPDEKPKKKGKTKVEHRIVGYIVGETCRLALECGVVQFLRGERVDDLGTVRDLKDAGIPVHPAYEQVSVADESEETPPEDAVAE